jgi:hypothetical protein
LVFSKDGEIDLLYFGSGTNVTSRVSGRLKVYDGPTSTALPKFVRLAFENGYELSHAGLLA